MLVLVLGLPRTGTTAVYTYLTTATKPQIALYEPFNYHSRTRGPEHDVLGKVRDDLRKLPRALAVKIARNSTWVLDWGLNNKPRRPWLGEKWSEILDELYELARRRLIILKDVYLWTELDELTRRYSEVYIILTLRDFESTFRALAQWLEGARKVHIKLVRKIIMKATQKLRSARRQKTHNASPSSATRSRSLLDSVRGMLLTLEFSRYARMVHNMCSIGILYRRLVGEIHEWRVGSIEDLRKMLESVYLHYVALVEKIRQIGNVL